MADDEEIVMTPSKSGNVTTIKIEKVKRANMDMSKVAHQAGGQHTGLVINKQTAGGSNDRGKAELQLEFKCFLVDNKTGNHVPESRVLKFWFAPDADYLDKVTGAYEFFKELVKPDNFPRDYVGFIKKVMKQLQQRKYDHMKKVDVELMQLQASNEPPPSPDVNFRAASGMVKEDTRPRHVIVQERLLLTLESAYPNVMPTDYLSDLTKSDEQIVREQLKVLQGRNLIREMEPGRWVRQVLDTQSEVKVVKQMPIQAAGQRPTVAVITSKYYEKLAVDAMMEDKTTFVKYKTEGESNVYTIGNIGHHKVVSTKLPAIGIQMREQIAAGSTTTRLLGTFGDVEHVLLVGVAGGVPHYTDFYKHPRLGDITLSTANPAGRLYVYCDRVAATDTAGGDTCLQYQLRGWAPVSDVIGQVGMSLWNERGSDPCWQRYIDEGEQRLAGQEVGFARPPPETDKLYMNIGGNDIIEVGHPHAPDDDPQLPAAGQPMLRSGAIAAGAAVIGDEALRLDFATRQGAVAYDTDFDQVLESIVGNRKESFGFVRGIADYMDGTRGKQWQPYAALAAAAFMKAIIERLPDTA